MGLVLLDSSVLIGLINPGDKHHVRIMEKFDASSLYAISTLTLTEVLPHAIAKGVAEAARASFEANLHQILDVGQEIAMAAAHVRARTGLRTPDAIISATATAVGAKLWTCDAALAKAHKGARLIA